MLKPAAALGGPARKRGTPEADLQRTVVHLLRLVLPAGAVVHHSANEVAGGGPTARRRQGILEGMGVHAGFADLIVLSEGRVLFLELKSKHGALQVSQAEFRDLVRSQGFAWELVRSLDDALAALRDNGFKTRLRPGP